MVGARAPGTEQISQRVVLKASCGPTGAGLVDGGVNQAGEGWGGRRGWMAVQRRGRAGEGKAGFGSGFFESCLGGQGRVGLPGGGVQGLRFRGG